MSQIGLYNHLFNSSSTANIMKNAQSIIENYSIISGMSESEWVVFAIKYRSSTSCFHHEPTHVERRSLTLNFSIL